MSGADLRSDFIRERFLRMDERRLLAVATKKRDHNMLMLLQRLSRLRSWEQEGRLYLIKEGENCRFKLATIVANGLYLVVTFGEYVPDMEKWPNGTPVPFEATGCMYRTSVYELATIGEPGSGGELTDGADSNTYQDASKNHMIKCGEYEKKSRVIENTQGE